MKKVLITGVSGTLGQQVLKSLLNDPSLHVIGISRDEQKQLLIKPHKRLTLYLGDIRDRRRLVEASRGVDTIFHFAALKCVDILEANPEESIATNVNGTENVLNAQRVNGVSRVILSSTDKAVYPINAYGACKALAEKLVLRNKNNVVVRYGNVLASRGSVIPSFIRSIINENRFHLTDEGMTRFFLKPSEAGDFVIQSAFGKSGGLKIYPAMKAVKILEMGQCIAEILGRGTVSYVVTGIRPGEKIHECLRGSHEGELLMSDTAPRFSKHELRNLLEPIVLGLARDVGEKRIMQIAAEAMQ